MINVAKEFLRRAVPVMTRLIEDGNYTEENIEKVYDCLLLQTKYSDPFREDMVVHKMTILLTMFDTFIFDTDGVY